LIILFLLAVAVEEIHLLVMPMVEVVVVRVVCVAPLQELAVVVRLKLQYLFRSVQIIR
jgi:hypothetical protein